MLIANMAVIFEFANEDDMSVDQSVAGLESLAVYTSELDEETRRGVISSFEDIALDFEEKHVDFVRNLGRTIGSEGS